MPIAIMGFWLIMAGLFLHREYGGPTRDGITLGQAPFVPQDQWMGIYIKDDQRVGYLHLRSYEASQDDISGQVMKVDASLETKIFGVVAGMDIAGSAWTASTGDQARFSFSLDASDTTMGLQGRIFDGQLTGTLDAGGEAIPLSFPVDSTLLLGGGIGLSSRLMPVLEPGQSAEVDAFDPMTMKIARARVTCTGTEDLKLDEGVVPTRIYETVLGAVKSRAWVNEDEEVLQATTPFGFTLRKIDPSALLIPVERAASSDLIRTLAIVPTGAQISADLDRLQIRIEGVLPEKIPHDPPWQRREGDTLSIVRPTLPQPGESLPAADVDTAPYLGSDAFVTADHETIRRQALEIVGDMQEPWEQAMLLYQWVFDTIEKKPVLSVPNALDVLRTRQGDCNEHTVLYTALARSLGVPTRIAIGLVYSDTLEGFGYHAWPEVYVGRQWIPIDPTLGQRAADATHIKLFNGSIDAWIQLAGYIGQIKLDVISAE